MVGGLSVKANKLVNAIASGKYGTQREAAEAAGMHEVSASKALSLAKVQRAIAEKQEQRADRAARIAAKSSATVLASLDAAADPMFALSAWKVATEIQREEPPTDELTDSDRATGAALLLQALVLGARIGARVGNERAAALIGAHLEGDLPPKVAALRSVRLLLRYVRGE